MRSVPYESTASGLVDESLHPIDQLDLLHEQACQREALGESDAVIECRIKQLALHQVLVYLHDFPPQPLVRAQAALAEAYAVGGYIHQAHDHLARAREVCRGAVYDDAQSQRLQVDLQISEGRVLLAEGQPARSKAQLEEAARRTRDVYGEGDVREARIQTMLADLAQKGASSMDEALKHLQQALVVREALEGKDCEEAVRLQLRMAELERQSGKSKEALNRQRSVVESLRQANAHPEILVDSSLQLARWLEAKGQDQAALETLEAAEVTVAADLDPEGEKAAEVKKDVALMLLKIGQHDKALQYLNDVHYLERCLHGSQSANVARTLKALGTVHLVGKRFDEADRCLRQALRIFEAEHPPNQAIIRDIHNKLGSLASI
jgi:tetratricopeptide (TPR) repeat protein